LNKKRIKLDHLKKDGATHLIRNGIVMDKPRD